MNKEKAKNISIKVVNGGDVTVFSEMSGMKETAAVLLDAFMHTLLTEDLDTFLDIVTGARQMLDDCLVTVCRAIIENTDLEDDEYDED